MSLSGPKAQARVVISGLEVLKEAIELLARLTLRQDTIASLVWQHCSDKEIAARLNISVRTVNAHVSQILRRLGVKTRVELSLLCERAWLADRLGKVAYATVPNIQEAKSRPESPR